MFLRTSMFLRRGMLLWASMFLRRGTLLWASMLFLFTLLLRTLEDNYLLD